MKMKHNKKRNTAFLYECLVKELTKSIVRKDAHRQNKIISIMKEFFYKNSPLKQDLKLYRSILENNKMAKDFAVRFLFETKKDYANLDRKLIFNEQTNLIKSINENLSPSAFANFISNYKDLASIGTYFSSSANAKSRLLIESKLVRHLTSDKREEQQMKHIDNLSYKTFVNKFNETYNRSLRKEQKDLLTNYIISFSDNGLGLKTFMNEEISRLKNELGIALLNEKKSKNEEFLAKLQQVCDKLESFSKMPIDEGMVKDLFYIQNLIQEVKRDA